MNRRRRSLLKTGSGVTLLSLLGGAGLLSPQAARADAPSWNKALFDTHSLPDTLKALGGSEPTPSKDIVFFQTPDIAENGAVVPVGISSNIPKTESIAILVEKNPTWWQPFSTYPPEPSRRSRTRVKMGQSSNIVALVKAEGKYYIASKEVKVTLGGCGGVTWPIR